MLISELKQKIESHQNIELPLVFVSEDLFLPKQYAEYFEPFVYVDNYVNTDSLFGKNTSKEVNILIQEELNTIIKGNYIVICKRVESSIRPLLEIVDFPKLEPWMIQDYAHSLLEGIHKQDIDWLVTICKFDINRVKLEIDRLCLFEPVIRQTMFEQFKLDGVYNDLSDLNIFTLSTAIQNKDLQSIKNVLTHLLTAATVVDVEPLGLYTLLYNNFKKMIKVWLSRNPSSESTGIPSNQLWAIKNLPRVYTKDQLIKLFSMLTELDSKYKQGNFPMELLVDYLILKCLLV